MSQFNANFSKLQAEIGGNVEWMITGAAPISTEVLDMCRVTLGCIILEGYGSFNLSYFMKLIC